MVPQSCRLGIALDGAPRRFYGLSAPVFACKQNAQLLLGVGVTGIKGKCAAIRAFGVARRSPLLQQIAEMVLQSCRLGIALDGAPRRFYSLSAPILACKQNAQLFVS